MNDRPRVRKIGTIVNQLIARRGYARAVGNDALRGAIADVIGAPLEKSFEVGNLKNGVLHVFVTDSVSIQEFNFQKRRILKRLQSDFPEDKVNDLRFRVQT